MSANTTAQGPGILDLVNKTLKLPTIPTVLVKLNEVANDPDSSAEDVANVISCDPSIATNLLRIVNSAYYGLQVRVSSINLAVSILGFNMTRKVALKAAIFTVFRKKKREAIPQFSPEAFWSHSIYTGVAAKVAAGEGSQFASMHPEDLYICGLLHDIGKIILYENAPKDFAEALAISAQRRIPLEEAEKEVFGFQHSDVGSVLAIKWFLPEDLTIAVRYHHNPVKDPFHQSLSSLIHLADWMAWSAEKPSAAGVLEPELDSRIFEQVGIDQDNLEDLLEKANEEYTKVNTSIE